MRLLYRFYDVTGGSIKIGGKDIRDVTQTSLRHAIGLVPQESVLFNETARYNIASVLSRTEIGGRRLLIVLVGRQLRRWSHDY